MKIERNRLVDRLEDFALRGSGVVVGDPGVGKTRLLLELRKRLKSTGTPHLLIPIDQLGNGSEDELRAELSYQGDLIEKLESELRLSGRQPGILLFDAFDAARSEQKRMNFLQIIRRAVRELRGLWNVVVTVRTYDAKRSRELLDLFGEGGGSGTSDHQDSSIRCRHLKIPLLTDHEVEQAVGQIVRGRATYEAGSQVFKKLLRTPFNIWLFESILSTPVDLSRVSDLRSQVQLLQLFWDRRVRSARDGDEREFVLVKATRKMVEERSLSTRKEGIYSPQVRHSWNALFSDGLLEEASSSGQRVSYSHNILFDFAVSLLLIEDEPADLVRFLSEDPSRPLFLRPSLTYYFTRLWYDAPDAFWNVLWHVLPNHDPRLRLFARLIPPVVIANEAQNPEQLAPLLKRLASDDRVANEAMLRILQALRALQIKNDELWASFLGKAVAHLNRDFAWELAVAAREMLRRTEEASEEVILRACGSIGRSLMRWVWREREHASDGWIDNLGAILAVPLVAETFGTDAEESRALLEKTLTLTKEENFPIEFLFRLTHEVANIWPHDPTLVASIYDTVFGHIETSEERTHMGGIIVPLTSTRRQDYDMCRYSLVQQFPGFLRAAPSLAAHAAITSLNKFIVAEHIARYAYEGIELDDITEHFVFRGGEARYVADGSYIWDEGGYVDKPIEMAHTLFDVVREMASSQETLTQLDRLLDVFRDTVWVAFFWRRLLRVATQVPETFASRLLDLCVAKPVQLGSETVWDLGAFLEAAAPHFEEQQIAQIERTLLALPGSEEDSDQREFLEHRRDRLLARIPIDRLWSVDARELRRSLDQDVEASVNRPLATFESWSEPYSEERFLESRGVDTNRAENRDLLEDFVPLEEFTSKWLNKVPTPEAVAAILPTARDLHERLERSSDAHEAVIDAAWSKLASSAATMSHAISDPHSDAFGFCREVLLSCSKHPSPKPDPERDREFTFPAWSPEPRNEAAEGLPWLALRRSDERILRAMENLVGDRVPSVRYLAVLNLFRISIEEPDAFWRLAQQVADQEANEVVLQALCHTLARVVAREEEKTIAVIERLFARALSHEEIGFSHSLVDLILWLFIGRENVWAASALDSLLAEPIRFANSLQHAVLEVSHQVTPQKIGSTDSRRTTQRAIEWQGKALDAAAEGINILRTGGVLAERIDEQTQEQLRDVYSIIDEVVTRLYFAADVNEELRRENEDPVSDEQRKQFYFGVKPLLEQVLAFARHSENGMLLAPTAHHFMELLNGVLKYDPQGVLHMAAGVAESSRSAGYNLDALAVREVVRLTEAILADHRSEVRQGQPLQDLLDLLDIFAETGWPEALNLVWRLDEVFR
jgi:hypothetical protein